nr:unnamed protein product [Callosobruchus analis]
MKPLVIEMWATDPMYASKDYITSYTPCHHFFLIWLYRWLHGFQLKKKKKLWPSLQI